MQSRRYIKECRTTAGPAAAVLASVAAAEAAPAGAPRGMEGAKPLIRVLGTDPFDICVFVISGLSPLRVLPLLRRPWGCWRPLAWRSTLPGVFYSKLMLTSLNAHGMRRVSTAIAATTTATAAIIAPAEAADMALRCCAFRSTSICLLRLRENELAYSSLFLEVCFGSEAASQ